MSYANPIPPRVLLGKKIILDKWECDFYEHKTPCDPYCFEKGTRDNMFQDQDWLRWHNWMQVDSNTFSVDEEKAKTRILVLKQMIEFEENRLAIKKEIMRIFDKNPSFYYVEIFKRK